MKNVVTTIDDVYNELRKEDVNITDSYQYIHPNKTNNKYVKMSLGRCWFNIILPDKYPKLIDYPINKKELYKILNEIYMMFPPEEAAQYIQEINKEAFKLSSIIPQTFSIDSLIIPENVKQEKNKILEENKNIENFVDILKNEAEKVLNLDNIKNSGIKNIIDSGAKMNSVDFAALTIAKAPNIDIEQNIIPSINKGLIDGYSVNEYYNDAASARRTLYIRAVGAADPGALARQTIYANSSTILGIDDCKTRKYLELDVTDSIFPKLFGRFMLDPDNNKLVEITPESKIIGKRIKLRSPLFCKDKTGICKICYGKLYEKLNSKYIGIIAGTVINESGIEGYAMKARHKSVQIEFKQTDFTKDLLSI